MTEASAPLSHRNRWGIPANGGPIDLRRAADPRPAVLSASPRDVVLDLARTALVLVDLQNDFCAPRAGSPPSASTSPCSPTRCRSATGSPPRPARLASR